MIWVYSDLEALSQAAAGLFAQQARQAIEGRGYFRAVLSGGHTPKRTYELLAQPPYRDEIDWRYVDVFWGDERCVPSDDPRNNARMARMALLDHVPVPPEKIYPIPSTMPPIKGAERYEDTLRGYFAGKAPRFDLIFLGLGENGHTASLFPETPVLDEKRRWVAEVYIEEEKLWRITMTAALINQAAVIAFLVQGTKKAGVLREVLQGPREANRLPAQLIQPTQGELHWLVDQEASSFLSKEA